MASVSAPYALCPLTVFDRTFERSAFVTGWLVEGTIDVDAIASALKRVTEKWRLLAGRVESVAERDTTKWMIKVPLGKLDPNYATFALTSSVSATPLTHYIPIPIPYSSPSLPHTLFIHQNTPRQYSTWKSQDNPLTCWHVTHFPGLKGTGESSYSCIGFARCHGVFDGVAAAFIVDALICELIGRDWTAPPLPSEGLNVNPLQEVLDKASAEFGDSPELRDASGYNVLGVTGLIKEIVWHKREKWWGNAQRQIFIIPGPIVSRLVEAVRRVRPEVTGSEHVSSGDVLVGWLMKVIYAQGTSDNTTVHCTNFASFRSVLPYEHMLRYPHNAFVPLPYPLYSVKDLKTLPLHELTRQMSAARQTLSMKHVVAGYRTMLEHPIAIPAHKDAQEAFLLSNVSASRILEADWGSVGASRTLCGYRYSCTPTELILTNSVFISGRLADSSLVLDTILNESRRELLQSAIGQMIAEYNASKWLSETS